MIDDSRSADRPPPDEVASPATMLVASRAEYLGDPRADIGRRVGDDALELFVDGEPAAALLPLMLQRRRDYIALHDAGSKTSLRLLGAVATALRAKVQRLAIRRQGQGVPLATICFVEVPGAGGQTVRVYSTDVDADSRGRQQLAMLLLACSRLGVVLVGEMPAHVLERALQPVRDAIAQGPWLNRDLLLVPLAAPGALPTLAPTLAGGSAVLARVTAVATRPNDAWAQVIGAWNRLGEPRRPPSHGADDGRDAVDARSPTAATPANVAAAGAVVAASGAPAGEPVAAPVRVGAAASTSAGAPTTMAASASVGAPRAADGAAGADSGAGAATGDAPWTAYLDGCRATLRGFEAGCLFSADSGAPVARIGAPGVVETLATQALMLRCTLLAAAEALDEAFDAPAGADPAIEASAVIGRRLLLLHPLPGGGAPLLVACLDAALAVPAITRQQLARVDAAWAAAAGGEPAPAGRADAPAAAAGVVIDLGSRSLATA